MTYFNHKNLNYSNGFTLAEVLITLVIIGIIAAITVPTLIKNTQNQEIVSRLKKTYSALSQVTNKIIADEGDVTGWTTSVENVFNLYKIHLSNARVCSNGTGCFPQEGYKWLGGSPGMNFDTNSRSQKLVLNDGTLVSFLAVSNECNMQNLDHSGSNNFCVYIIADINGVKKPNVYGRDAFMFVVKREGLYPAGCDIDGYCSNAYRGHACTCKVLKENAMNY